MAPSCLHDAPVYLFPPLLGFLAFFSLGLLSLLRSRRNQTNLLFAAMCLMGGTLNLDVALVSLVRDRETALLIDRTFYVLFVFSVPVYVRFTHSFLGITSRKNIERSALFISTAFMIFVPTDLFVPALREYAYGRIAQAGPVFHAFSIFGGIAVIYCASVLFLGVSKARDNEERHRIRYVVSGLGLSALLIFMSYITISGADLYPFGSFSFIPALILSIGVLKYDLIGINAAIRKGILYFLLTLVLTFSYLLIIYLAQFFLSTSASGVSPFPALLISLAFAVLFQPLREKVQAAVDRVFFKGKYNYQATLKRVSRALGTLHDAQAIKDFLIASVNGALHVSAITLLTFEDRGMCAATPEGSIFIESSGIGPRHPVAQVLLERKACLTRAAIRGIAGEQERAPGDLFSRYNASLLVPIISGERLAGIICLGDKRSGDLFVHEDLELLMTAANQAAVALDNARAYSRLEEMNRDLEKRVAERTEDLVRALHEKEAAQHQLIQSESLAAIGQLVAGTAHELNNPLASASSLVQSGLECLEAGTWKDSADAEMIAELIADLEFSLREMKRARDIIKSLLGVSRQTNTLMESVDVNAVIGDALLVLHNQYKNRDLRIDTDFGDVPAVMGNFGSLGQVMMNVIKNSIEAVPAEKGEIRLRTACRGGVVAIECSDNGPGIPEAIRKDIFKPFYTTKEAGKGTGLGLYISHEIVKRHGGSLQAGDRPGGGAMFRIEIPGGGQRCRDC
jgi:two-component system NtrC family sensor kinase